jgi:hypothetical protein
MEAAAMTHRPHSWPRAYWFSMSRRNRRAWQRDQHPRVQCARCLTWHKSMFSRETSPASRQGQACAARYANGVVYGYYGSMIADMRKFPITAPGLPAQLDPVCDACIQGWVDAGYTPPVDQWLDLDSHDFDGG